MEDMNHGKVMLIVTDEDVLKQLEGSLRKEYILVKVNSPLEAIQQTKDFIPDLMILDYMAMETADYETCKEFYDMADTKGIPVILLTSSEDEGSLDIARISGISDYITKPIKESEVQRRVRNYIELKMLRDRLRINSLRDNLTKIANRQRLIEVLRLEWERAKRNGTVLSVIVLDIDSFKRYNDIYGHEQGDECLFTIAQIIKKILKRPSDQVARWGGEEFACIIPETDLQGALLIGENIRKAIHELKIPHAISNTETSVTVSIGASSMRPSPNGSYEDILRLAEKALDMAKETGGNKVEAEIA